MKEGIQQTKSFTETNILSSFLQKSQPPNLIQTNISRYVSFIVNQKTPGATISHLAGTPSLFFDRMVHLYTTKQVPTIVTEANT
jgi:hypothetical protein